MTGHQPTHTPTATRSTAMPAGSNRYLVTSQCPSCKLFVQYLKSEPEGTPMSCNGLTFSIADGVVHAG